MNAQAAAFAKQQLEAELQALGGHRRYAGAAIAAMGLPYLAASVDDQQEGPLRLALATLPMLAGNQMGRSIADLTYELDVPENREEYIRKKTSELKKQSQEVMKTSGVQAANEFFAKGKEQILRDVSPYMGEMPLRSVEKAYEQKKINELLYEAAKKKFSRTPLQMRRNVVGGLIGSVASAPLAYHVLRGGPIEEEQEVRLS